LSPTERNFWAARTRTLKSWLSMVYDSLISFIACGVAAFLAIFFFFSAWNRNLP
jgi:hypothetical protein